MIVVDANVAAKWYMPERGSEAALDLLTSTNPLVAPELIRLEVLAALTRRIRTGEATVKETEKRCLDWRRHLQAGAISLIPESDLLDDAVRLAMKIRHTLQDCLYLAAAKRLDAQLVTADEPFYTRAKPSFERISFLSGCERN